jgi:hypothetical protein
MRTAALLLPFFALASCARPPADRSANPTAASASGAATTASAAPATTGRPAAAPEPPVKHSEHCPAGMLEVDGLYCTALMHHCVKGGKTSDRQPTDYPDPYYCDEYKQEKVACLGKEEPKHFCIDEYEWPNQKGAIPQVMVTWYESKRLCEEQGKRLCGDDEWTLACEGPEHLPYTYGWKRDRTACNIDKPWIKPDDGALSVKDGGAERIEAEVARLSQRVPSGAVPGCKSPYGVMDMGGNVDEWAVNVTLHGKPFMSIFKGGHWCSGARNRCRPTTESHDETTAYYAEGFRCCADPK